MKTKYISYIAAGMLAAAGLGSCSDNWVPDIDETGVGQLKTSSIIPDIKNGEKIVEDQKGALKVQGKSRASYNVSDFIVTVEDANGMQEEQWTYSEMPSLPTFPVGTHKVIVRSHNVQPAEWNKPYFLGEQTFQIANGEITEVPTIVCTMANIAVAVKFDDKLLAQADNGGADLKVTVTSVPGTVLEFTPSENRTGYFEASDFTTLKVNFTGTISGREENTTAVLTNVEAGQRRNITMTLKGNTHRPPEEMGNIQVDGEGINVDFSVDETDYTGTVDEGEEKPYDPTHKPGEEEKPDDPDDPTPPTPSDYKIEFSSETLDLSDGAVNDANKFADEGIPAEVLITSDKGIRDLLVEIVSPTLTDKALTDVGLTSKFDLAHPAMYPLDNPRDLTEGLEGLGFPVGDAVIGQKEVLFKITEFVPLIPVTGSGLHDFIITVTDMEGNVKSMTLKFKSVALNG